MTNEIMTIDEAIKHWEKVASGHERNCEIFAEDIELCAINREWAEKTHQLAKWLKELKTYQEGIEYIKSRINYYRNLDMWDVANSLELALEILGVENDNSDV